MLGTGNEQHALYEMRAGCPVRNTTAATWFPSVDTLSIGRSTRASARAETAGMLAVLSAS